MAKKCTFTITSGSSLESESAELEFGCKEIEVLRLFNKNSERLRNSKLIIKGFPKIQHLEINGIDGLNLQISPFDYEDACAFLHLARPIFLDKEPASFKKTMALFGIQAKEQSLFAKHLKSIHRLYREGEYSQYFQLKVTGISILKEKTILAWLNGVEYHQDQEKAKLVDRLEAMLSEETVRGLFISLLSGRVAAVAKLKDMVSGVMDKST